MYQITLLFILYELIVFTESNNDIGIRKNIIHLSEYEKTTILNGLYLMKRSPSKYNNNYTAYDYFAHVHKYATKPLESYGHVQWSFLPWHRSFLYLFEKELQFYTNDTSLMLPYWDLSNELSTHMVLNDISFLGGNGNESAEWMMNQQNMSLNCDKFPMLNLSVNDANTANYSCLARNIGNGRFVDNRTYGTTLPDITIWDEIFNREYLYYDIYPYHSLFMNYSQYNKSFRAILEGCDPSWQFQKDVLMPLGICWEVHGNVHSYIGGHLASSASPLDPLFFMLHNWIDLIWAKWQDKNGDDTFPMEFVNQSLFDINISGVDEIMFNGEIWTSLDVLNHRKSLFYEYDVQQSQTDDSNDETEFWIYVLIGCGILLVIVVTTMFCYSCRKSKGKKRRGYQNF